VSSDDQKTNSDSATDKRRHPRINIQNEFERAQALKGAALKFEGSENSLRVFDMSVSGLACENDNSIEVGKIVKAQIILGDLEPQQIELKAIWASEKVMGLRFEHCEANVKLAIGDFLQDRIVGQHMISVDPKYFAEHVDFQAWYHGPNNTNVFVWRNEAADEVAKVMVAFEGQSLIFERGEFRAGGGQINWQEQATYSAETLPGGETSEEDLPVLLDKDSPLVKRSIELLSQVSFDQDSIQKLIRQMESV
jgi:hypothetical protein